MAESTRDTPSTVGMGNPTAPYSKREESGVGSCYYDDMVVVTMATWDDSGIIFGGIT